MRLLRLKHDAHHRRASSIDRYHPDKGLTMNILTLYAKKRPDGCVEIRNSNGSLKAFYDKFHSQKPDYRNKYIIINCYKWALVWSKP